jgi:DNA modification methylase
MAREHFRGRSRSESSLALLDTCCNPIGSLVLGDARALPLANESIDLVTTSPPYWQKRDYGSPNQIGQEETPERYVENLLSVLRECKRVLRPTGSVFLNIGDTYYKRGLSGIPALLEVGARREGWRLRNRVIWAKYRGMPDPAKDRLANRHEFILHLVKADDYYYDLFGYTTRFGRGANPGDVWTIDLERNMGSHLAPYPEELVERTIELACPKSVCVKCGQPRRRVLRRTAELDPDRPQARRAMDLARKGGLTPAHIEAVQSFGISDVGKATRIQNGTGRSSGEVTKLALEAKAVLGGYFREFHTYKKESTGWTRCACNSPFSPGVVLDPFVGTGTTVRVAQRLSRSAVGIDLSPPKQYPSQPRRSAFDPAAR